MSLDVYVMPLWRFKVGDFHSPIEAATGIHPKILTADGVEERPARVGWLARWRARREVAAIRKAVAAANRVPVRWTDEGGVIYARQSRGFEALRAYAKWLDCREQFPEFGPAPEGNYYEHPIMAARVDGLSCPHLVEHDCYAGYYLPCEFEQLVEVEPYLIFGTWPSSRSVGSALFTAGVGFCAIGVAGARRIPVPGGRSADSRQGGLPATARGRRAELLA